MIFDRKQQLNWKIRPFAICLNPERLVGWIRAGGICVRMGDNCLKYLKSGWNRTKERGHKDFKKGGTSCVKEWVPYKQGVEPPYELWCCTYELMRQVKVSSTQLISEVCLAIYLRKLNLLQMQKVQCICLHAQQPCKNFTHHICTALFSPTFDMSSQHKCQRLF